MRGGENLRFTAMMLGLLAFEGFNKSITTGVANPLLSGMCPQNENEKKKK